MSEVVKHVVCKDVAVFSMEETEVAIDLFERAIAYAPDKFKRTGVLYVCNALLRMADRLQTSLYQSVAYKLEDLIAGRLHGKDLVGFLRSKGIEPDNYSVHEFFKYRMRWMRSMQQEFIQHRENLLNNK